MAKNSTFLAKKRPTRTNPLISTIVRGFHTPNYPAQCFKFDVIRFTGYGVIAEKSCVGQLANFFRAPCRKNNVLDQKMIVTFLMVSTYSITMQSLGMIVQCAPAVGSKIWCLSLFFFCQSLSEAGALFVRREQFEQLLCHGLWVDFDAVFSVFFRKSLPFQVDQIVRISVARWGHNFREIAVKNCEKSKNRWKSLCAPIWYRQLRHLKKLLHYFRARNVDVHLYIFFLLMSLQRLQQVTNFVQVVHTINTSYLCNQQLVTFRCLLPTYRNCTVHHSLYNIVSGNWQSENMWQLQYLELSTRKDHENRGGGDTCCESPAQASGNLPSLVH